MLRESLRTRGTVVADLDLAVGAARAHEDLHVNALFRDWADPVLDAAGVATGQQVLDVACGTGVVARHALARVGPSGRVTGLDAGPGMLAVAEQIEPDVRWVEGDAADLPFDDEEFDAVVSSFGLMFFENREQAVREMLRCARPAARVAVTVWESLERSEAYSTTVELLERMAGRAAADALRAPFVLGDPEELANLFERSGAGTVSVQTRLGTARFPSVRAMVEADLRGWLPVMGVDLDDHLIEAILAEAETGLSDHVTSDGTMEFDAPAHIVTAQPVNAVRR